MNADLAYYDDRQRAKRAAPPGWFPPFETRWLVMDVEDVNDPLDRMSMRLVRALHPAYFFDTYDAARKGSTLPFIHFAEKPRGMQNLLMCFTAEGTGVRVTVSSVGHHYQMTKAWRAFVAASRYFMS